MLIGHLRDELMGKTNLRAAYGDAGHLVDRDWRTSGFQRFTVRRQNNHLIGGSQGIATPVSASDSSCHGAADSTPVLLPESSLAQTTITPSRKAESQLPLGGTTVAENAAAVSGPGIRCCRMADLYSVPK
jgi:hypothetical protein